MEKTFEIKDLLNILRKNKILITSIPFVCLLIGFIYTYFIASPIYESKTDLLVNTTPTANTAEPVSPLEIDASLKLIETYQYILKSQRMADLVIKDLDGLLTEDEFLDNVKAESNGNSQIISIIVENKNPDDAALIANKTAVIFQSEIKKLMKIENVNILTIATPYSSTSKPILLFNLLLSFAAGLILATIFVLIKELKNKKFESKKGITDLLGIPYLGEIPAIIPQGPTNKYLDERYNKLVAHTEPHSSSSEAYRSVRANLDILRQSKQPVTILVTSTSAGDGKSLTCGNLAVTLAKDNKKVVFVDSDMRKPNGHSLFNLHNRCGLTNYLTGFSSSDEIIQSTAIPKLSFISAGPISPNPHELIISKKMDLLIDRLKQKFDVILFDSSPLLVSDSILLSGKMDGCIYVLNARKTNRDDANEKIELLKRSSNELIGAILNEKKTHKSNPHYYYGGYMG
ncbi:polysaccharide biosynthesis tyrosine autokinase [Bacillus sp. SJS]|uniref:polysaccharide biosynthesis tyrosine autokinase n=1 Tax=Bacillus sp. SJS TaxID=1423321 RepID=UPI00068A64F5|nr:polysaccharide biosynthesis tyrosine autokinase [Bacillus sp. SJS]KZZ86287.1 hypothetical protein AS29_001575 [Bacillus sp. SJS]